MQLGLVLSLAFAVVIALFAVQNTTPVALNFLTLHVDQVAVSLLVLAAAMLGAALTFAFGLPREIGHQRELRSLRDQLRARESEANVSLSAEGRGKEEALSAPAASEEAVPPLPNPSTSSGQAPPPPGGRE